MPGLRMPCRASRPGWTAACLLACCTVARAQGLGELRGTVTDAGGEPIAGAAVTLAADVPRTVRTGTDGRFRFKAVPEGNREVAAAVRGLSSVVERVLVSRDRVTTIVLVVPLRIREHVTVTAARTGDRDLQSVPMAVSALTARALEGDGVRGLADLAGRAPAVTFAQSLGFAQVTIRGIGASSVLTGTDPSAAIYLDGVYLARPVVAAIPFLDMDRVEVLRGPQGTLYGRNAAAGAVNLVTRAPTAGLDASVRVTAGTAATRRVDARASGPILGQRVLGSAAVLRSTARGFVRSVDDGAWLGGEDASAARAKLLVSLDRRVNLLVSADAARSDPTPLTWAKVIAVKPGFNVTNPPAPFEVRSSHPAGSLLRQQGASARLSVRLPWQMTLTSLSAYRALDYDVTVDSDITELNLTGTGIHERQHQWSQEATLAAQTTRASWIAGVFLFRDVDRQQSTIQMFPQRVESRASACPGASGTPMPSRTTRGRRSSAWSCARTRGPSSTPRPPAASRAADSTSPRSRRDAASRPSGSGATKEE